MTLFLLFAFEITHYPFPSEFYRVQQIDTMVFLPNRTGGLIYVSSPSFRTGFLTEIEGLSSLNVMGVGDGNDRLYVITAKGLDIFTKDMVFVEHLSLFSPLFPDTIPNFLYTKDDVLYIGFNNGLAYMNPDIYPDSVFSIRYPFSVDGIVLYRDTFFLATSNGLYKTSDFRDTVSVVQSSSFSSVIVIDDTLYCCSPERGIYNYTVGMWEFTGEGVTSVSKVGNILFASGAYNVWRKPDDWVRYCSLRSVGVFQIGDTTYVVHPDRGIFRIVPAPVVWKSLNLPFFVPGSEFIEDTKGRILVSFGSGRSSPAQPNGLLGLSVFSNGEWHTLNTLNEWHIKGRLWHLAQDSKGYIWIGCWSGVSDSVIWRWDGSDTTLPQCFMPPEPASAITFMAYGPGDTLWIGGIDNIIYSLYTGGDSYSWKVYKKADMVWSRHYAFDRSGRLYLGTGSHTFENGVFYKDGDNFAKIDYDFGEIILAMASDRLGNIWVGSEAGLFKITGTSVLAKYDSDNTELYPAPVSGIAFDRDNRCWIVQSGAGVLYRDGLGLWHRLPEFSDITTEEASHPMFVDSKNRLWIGTYQGIFTINIDSYVGTPVIEVFPNPVPAGFSGALTVRGEDISGSDILVFDSGGKLVSSTSASGNSQGIPVPSRPGLYILVIKNGSAYIGRSKFVVLK